MKTRVSITLDSKLLKALDAKVDGIYVKSRSDAVEKILKSQIMGKKTAVILSGGRPEKLFIRALGVYRPLVDVGGTTLIEYIINRCREAGFSNIIIVGFSQVISKMYEAVGNGEKYGVDIRFIEETKELGTAKTLEMAKKYLTDDFLFLPCDSYFDFDLKKLWEFHKSYRGVVTVGIHTRANYKFEKGIVEMDGYHITSYEENPKSPKTQLCDMFIGFMSPEIFNIIPPGEVSWSLQENVFPKLAGEGKLIGYPVAGDWVNVNTREDASKLIGLIKKNK